MVKGLMQPALTLAGRDRELAVLHALFDDAAAGQARSVVVLGAAGVGKTALVKAAVSSREDCEVLLGTCLPLVSVGVPFLALRDVIRNAGRRLSPPDLDSAVGEGAELTTFDGWVTRLTESSPVVLFIDDLHWADQRTLDVLTYLVAGPASRQLAIVATAREEELRSDHPLQRWLVHVRRLPGVAVLGINHLDRAATAAQMAAEMGGLPHQSLIDDVFAKSQGNAYLTRLIVERVPLETRRLDQHLPHDLRSAISHAWSTAGHGAMDAVTGLAVGGSPRSVADVAVIVGRPESTVRIDLQPALDAGLLRATSDGLLWFRHPLDAEVLENRLAVDRRSELHASYASHLSDGSLRETGWLAGAVADHWLRSGDWRRARVAAIAAATEAEDSAAWPDAVRMLLQAATLPAGQLHDPAVLLRLRQAAECAGSLEIELTAIESLLASPSTRTSAADTAVLLVRRSLVRYWTGRQSDSIADARAAAEVAAAAPATAGHAIAMAYLAISELERDEPSALGHAELALAEARALQDDRALSWALIANANVAIAAGDEGRAVALAEEAAAVALQSRDWSAFTAATASESNAQDALSSDTVIKCLRKRREQLIVANAPDMYIGLLAAGEADGLMATGQWEACQDRLRDVFASDPGPLPDALARLTAARLATWQGRQQEAEQHLARVDELVDVSEMFAVLEVPVVRAEVRMGTGDAAAALEAAMAGTRFERLPPQMCEWLLPLAARAAADLAQDARDLGGDTAKSIAAIQELASSHPHTLRYPTPGLLMMNRQFEALDLLYAAEIGRGLDVDDQTERWLAAVDKLAQAQLPWEHAYAKWRAAEALLIHQDDRRRGGQVLREALAASQRLQARPLEEDVRALARRARVTLAQPLATVAIKTTVSLTPREREILALVVAGHTYGEIARALFISEKTVSTHISHLLAKTSTRNRIELASAAERVGSFEE